MPVISDLLSLGRSAVPYMSCVLTLALLGVLGLELVIRSKTGSPLLRSGTAATPAETHPWVLQFPPSRRHTLAGLGLTGSGIHAGPHGDIHPEVLRRRAVPSARTLDWEQDDLYTPTGFSTQEIRALGRFPDYSVLSGVRYPRPYGAHFDIKKARFRPFRPVRWPYHQTMAYYRFDPDWWVELEQNYVTVMGQRQELKKKHGDLIFFSDPGSELACRELMEMLVQFVCKRYPQYFTLDDDNTILHNRLLDTRTHLLDTPPLEVVYQNIPEDYALVLRDETDGHYYLRAAMVCSSVGWDVGMHRGRPLRRIHEGVPDYADKMALSMDRFFARLPADQPIQRCSWSLEDHAPLFSSPRMAGAGEPWQRSRFAGRAPAGAGDVWLRCDYQTLRRLPLSGAVAFNFKAVFSRLAEIRDEPFVPALLLRVLRGGKKSLIDYKAVGHVRDVTAEACEVWAREQVDKEMVPEDWDVRTLDESPFFPGWEEKWHAQQGF